MPTIMPSVDFDSTLTDNSHLWHLIDRENGTDWDDYGIQCALHGKPGPAYPLAKYWSVKREPWIIVSGRSEHAREPSMQWLHEHELFPWAVFLSDERHNRMPHGAWKALRLKEIQSENGWTIPFHIDDITDVAQSVDADPDLGFPVILVHTMESGFIDHLG